MVQAEKNDTVIRELIQTRPKLAEAATRFSEHAVYTDGFIVVPVETLQDALELAERNDPAALYLLRDGSTSFLPAWTAEEDERAELLGAPWFYELEDPRFGADKSHVLKFFTVVGEYRIRVNVHVKSDPETRLIPRYATAAFGRTGREIERTDLDDFSGHFNDRIKWYTPSGEYMQRHTLFVR
jgi:hypothetical protein